VELWGYRFRTSFISSSTNGEADEQIYIDRLADIRVVFGNNSIQLGRCRSSSPAEVIGQRRL
jgi:hypothetical protein